MGTIYFKIQIHCIHMFIAVGKLIRALKHQYAIPSLMALSTITGWNIMVRAPLVLQNCLPMPVHITLKARGAATATRYHSLVRLCACLMSIYSH